MSDELLKKILKELQDLRQEVSSISASLGVKAKAPASTATPPKMRHVSPGGIMSKGF